VTLVVELDEVDAVMEVVDEAELLVVELVKVPLCEDEDVVVGTDDVVTVEDTLVEEVVVELVLERVRATPPITTMTITTTTMATVNIRERPFLDETFQAPYMPD
jgi:hypothetical protein